MKQFTSETNGYNRKEVNKFLSDVIKETDELIEKYKEQEKQIQKLQEQVGHYQDVQNTIKETVLEDESDHIIMEAKREASEIINDALERAEQVETQRKLLEKKEIIAASREMDRLNQEFRKAGRSSKKEIDDELWEEFRAVKDEFYEKKRLFFEELDK